MSSLAKAGPAHPRNANRNAEGKTKVTLLHFTINTNQSPHSGAALDALEASFQEQLTRFVLSWPHWLAADSVQLVDPPPYQGGIEVGPTSLKVHAHLVMTFVHRTWVDLKLTRAKIKKAKRTLGLTLFAYVGVQVGHPSEYYMKLYADKDAGPRLRGTAGPARVIP